MLQRTCYEAKYKYENLNRYLWNLLKHTSYLWQEDILGKTKSPAKSLSLSKCKASAIPLPDKITHITYKIFYLIDPVSLFLIRWLWGDDVVVKVKLFPRIHYREQRGACSAYPTKCTVMKMFLKVHWWQWPLDVPVSFKLKDWEFLVLY